MPRKRAFFLRVLTLASTATLFFMISSMLSSCGGTSSGISSDEAREIVLQQIVGSEEGTDEFIVFVLADPLGLEDTLQPFIGTDLKAPADPISFENETWFFWVDDAPGAAFAHKTRYVLIDRVTEEVTVKAHDWWPVLNGESLWVDIQDYWDESNWAYANVEWRPSRLDHTHRSHGLARFVGQSLSTNGSPGSALVVNGWDEGQSLKEDMQESAGEAIGNYSSAGFDTEYFGPPVDSGQPERIHNWILDQALELKTSQTAVIYIIGHGSHEDQNGFVKLGKDWLSEEDLSNWLRMFDPGVHVIVVIDSCYSGSFIDSLRDLADVTITSTGAQDYAYGDYERNDPDPEDKGMEFSNSFDQDWDEIMSDPDQQEEARQRALQQGTNFWEEIHMMSYLSALEKDGAYLNGKTFPNAVRGDPLSTKPSPIDYFISYTDLTFDITKTLKIGLKFDPPQDHIYSQSIVEIGAPKLGTDITFFEAFFLAFDPATRIKWFGNTLFPCDTPVAEYLVVCAQGAGPMPEGDVLMLIMVLDADIPIESPPDEYIFSAVFDTDGDPNNNFKAQSPWDWDYYQGTDRWYIVGWDTSLQSWYLDVSDPGKGLYTAPSHARAAILGNLVVFFVPADEVVIEQPGYRLTAFAHDGSFAADRSSGDVTGADPTEPLSIVPAERVIIGEP